MRFLIFVLAVIVALVIMKYTDPIVRTIGMSDLAERYLGPGGTYLMWKLIAVIVVIAGLFYWIPPAFLR